MWTLVYEVMRACGFEFLSTFVRIFEMYGFSAAIYIKILSYSSIAWWYFSNFFLISFRSFSCQKFPTRCNGSLSNFFPKYRIQFIKVHKIYFRFVAMALKLQQYTCYSLKKVVKYKNLGEIYIFNVNISASPFQLFSM